MVALSRNVARKHAMEMLLTGDMISAEDADRIGLVNRVVPAGRGRMPRRSRLPARLPRNRAACVKIGKEASTASSRWSSPMPIATPPK